MSSPSTNGRRDPIEVGLDHSWNWFAIHAAQRLQLVNFWLVAVALLSTAYATTLKDHRYGVAAVIAAIGVSASVAFNRLDHRTRELVKAGEQAMQPLEEKLAVLADEPSLNIVSGVEQSRYRFAKYSVIINGLEYLIAASFAGALVYAACQ